MNDREQSPIADDAAAMTASATWKFDFLDTVNADPKANGACLGVIKAYLNFASKNVPKAFCPIPDLMLRTGCTRPTVIKARNLLVTLGYLIPEYDTDEGATMYRLCNARQMLIAEHLEIAREATAAERRDRKKRQRGLAKVDRRKETLPPYSDGNERNFTPDLKETLPNTLDEYPRDYLSEYRGESIYGVEGHSAGHFDYGQTSGDDPNRPFPVPVDENEAERMLDDICDGVIPAVRRHWKSLLMHGALTPNLVFRARARDPERRSAA
jgi:hypothetical protein